MHSLHNIFNFERKKRSCSIFTAFVYENLSTAMTFTFLTDFLTAFLEKH